ncbi:MAG TPA: aminoglycoside phosphotransferase family protein [Acidimicrobiales bacterium]|nr:aminoglycoside phosphotransferase family protein [Acidimicrobiales bacterium]
MPRPVVPPDAVLRKAEALGPAGSRWLDDLGDTVAHLEAQWGVRVGAALSGGSASLVAPAVATDGSECIVKIGLPDGLEGQGPFDSEVRVLTAARGRGYARVLAVDELTHAVLLERLGRPLLALGLGVEVQIEIIAATLQHAWSGPLPAGELRTGADQAGFLSRFIAGKWEECGRPCPSAVVEQALRCADTRRAAFDPTTAVVIHGDAHPANVLEELTDGRPSGRFKLIDPDPMVSERAHDLAIPLRDWSEELLAADPVALALAWCAQLGRYGGAPARAVWEWAFTERVSTGLFLLSLGQEQGHRLLEVARAWTGMEWPGMERPGDVG